MIKLKAAAQRAAGRRWTRRWRVKLAVEDRGCLSVDCRLARMVTLENRLAKLKKTASRIAQDALPRDR